MVVLFLSFVTLSKVSICEAAGFRLKKTNFVE